MGSTLPGLRWCKKGKPFTCFTEVSMLIGLPYLPFSCIIALSVWTDLPSMACKIPSLRILRNTFLLTKKFLRTFPLNVQAITNTIFTIFYNYIIYMYFDICAIYFIINTWAWISSEVFVTNFLYLVNTQYIVFLVSTCSVINLFAPPNFFWFLQLFWLWASLS